jgi:hypothetical protein
MTIESFITRVLKVEHGKARLSLKSYDKDCSRWKRFCLVAQYRYLLCPKEHQVQLLAVESVLVEETVYYINLQQHPNIDSG